MARKLAIDLASDGLLDIRALTLRQWHLLNDGLYVDLPGVDPGLPRTQDTAAGAQAIILGGGLQFMHLDLGGSWNVGVTSGTQTATKPEHGAPVRGAARHEIALYSVPTDTLFANQWHLQNTGQNGGTAGVDINVTKVWDEFTGVGVHVGIWDDGIQYTHHDLDGNYDASLHIADNSADGIHDPLPQDPGSEHGTAVAGLIAAESDGVGTVGAAYGASITGVDMFYDPDLVLEDSVQHLKDFDVTNHSWGFTTPYAANQLDGSAFWQNFFGGFSDSVNNGRGGLGTINMVANGNDRSIGRDGNDSNFTNMPQTIAVAAVAHTGFVSWYSSPGANLLVATTSNGLSGIWTTDRTGADGYSTGANQAGNTEADYTSSFGGTSAATPITAGVVALMLETNPLLGWRDVQEILAVTARHTGTAVGAAKQFNELYLWDFNGSSHWNGGGMHFSNDYGFGLTDALAAVRLAESWNQQSTSTNWITSNVGNWAGSLIIPEDAGAVGNAVTFTFDVLAGQAVDLETVGLMLGFDAAGAAWTGDYLITLTSPDGTTSTLSRPANKGDSATDSWNFTSNQFRGETGVGTWTVSIDDQWSDYEGTVLSGALTFHGSAVSTDDTHIFTNEFSDYAGLFGHTTAINDSNGGLNDTLNMAAVSLASVVNLTLDTFTIDGTAGTTTGFENVIGGDGDDQFTGSSTNNLLEGWRGSDTLSGMAGNDFLIGGAGGDTLNGGDDNDKLFGGAGGDAYNGGNGSDSAYFTDSSGVGVDLTNGLNNTGDAIGDTFDSIEIFVLSAAADSFTGDGADNWVRGLAGADTLSGGGGNDVLIGGTGADTLDGGDNNDKLYGGADGDAYIGGNGTDYAYFTDSSGVGVDLTNGLNNTGDAVGDTFDSIEVFVLSAAADSFTGDNADNWVRGLGGADTLSGGGGNDLLEGGAGADTLDGGDNNDKLFGGADGDAYIGGNGTDYAYFTDSAGVGVDLTNGLNNTGDAIGDTFDSIEIFVLSAAADSFAGDSADNWVRGLGGVDNLSGGDGNDVLEGGAGVDMLDGGLGKDKLFGDGGNDTLSGGADTVRDVFYFQLNFGTDTITDFALAIDDIVFQGIAGITQFSDLLLSDDGGGNAVVDAGGGNTVVLTGVDFNALSTGDFIFW